MFVQILNIVEHIKTKHLTITKDGIIATKEREIVLLEAMVEMSKLPCVASRGKARAILCELMKRDSSF